VGQERAMYFSVLDQKSGYYSIRIHPDSRPKTAFSTRSGRWQWRSLAMGLVNAPASYCQLVSQIFHRELQEYALIYLDDLIILSRDFSTPMSRLQNVFDKIRDAKLRLHPGKSHFCLSEVKYLGHRFSREGISMDESKIEVIKTFPQPRNVRELRQFLGLMNYFKRFICSYSAITSPLRLLLQKDTPVEFGPDQQETFEILKDKLCRSHILVYPDPSRPYIVTTDACKTGLGYISSQMDDQGRERAISFNGRATKSYAKNYTVSELELAGIMAAVLHTIL